MLKQLDPDGHITASNVNDLAAALIVGLPLPGVDGSPLDSDDIWLVVILACVNQTSIWETCKETSETPCDDTVLAWLHILDRAWLEFAANLLLSLGLISVATGMSRISSASSATVRHSVLGIDAHCRARELVDIVPLPDGSIEGRVIKLIPRPYMGIEGTTTGIWGDLRFHALLSGSTMTS